MLREEIELKMQDVNNHLTYDSIKYNYDPYNLDNNPETKSGITGLAQPPLKLGCIIDYLKALGDGEGCTEDDDLGLYSMMMLGVNELAIRICESTGAL